jgi:hypothetical protein
MWKVHPYILDPTLQLSFNQQRWGRIKGEYPQLAEKPIKIASFFPVTTVCETGFFF